MFQLAILMLFIFTILIHCFSPSDVLQRLKAGYLVILNPQNLMTIQAYIFFSEKKGGSSYHELVWKSSIIQQDFLVWFTIPWTSLLLVILDDVSFFRQGMRAPATRRLGLLMRKILGITFAKRYRLTWRDIYIYIYIYVYKGVDSHFWCQVLLLWDFLAVLIPLVTKPSNKNENSWKWKCHKV